MKKVYLFTILLLIVININSQNSNASEYIEIKRTDLIGFGDYLKYNPIEKDSLGNVIGEFVLPQNMRDKYLGRVYQDNDHVEIVRLKKDSSLLNGKYKIIQLPILGLDEVNLSKIEYVLAEFNNGKREGTWCYFLPNHEILSTTKIIQYPIKMEIYKNGIPDGVWTVNGNGKKVKYFYKNGILEKEFIKEDNNVKCLFYNKDELINELFVVDNKIIYTIYNGYGDNYSRESICIENNKLLIQSLTAQDKENVIEEIF